jgi:hypothetical protein
MKRIALFLAFAIFVFASGCADKAEDIPAGQIDGVESTPSASPADHPAGPTESPFDGTGDGSIIPQDEDIDMDLTLMDDTEAYELAYELMLGEHMEKVIKVRGPYAHFEFDDEVFHHVVVTDEEACCAAFVEFRWIGDNTFPDDYPEENTVIEVIGIIKSYEFFDLTMYYLEVDGITDLGYIDTKYLDWGESE